MNTTDLLFMGISDEIRKLRPTGGVIYWTLPFLFFILNSYGQETNSHVSGIVRSEKGQPLPGATVLAVHDLTKNTYVTTTNGKGYFYFFNVRPGGPYSVTISHTGRQTLSSTGVFLSYSGSNFYSPLRGNELSEFVLSENNIVLPGVTVKASKQVARNYGIETNIDNDKLQSMPSVGRNFQDYVRLTPQATVNGEGMISLAGQNNKFNSFFIDGSNINDPLGLAISGTAGGQTGSPPISMEAIEELKVSLSPYDVQFSNFTGGSINAITRSGSNQFKSSAWYFFRNEKMAGKSPLPVEKPGSPGVYERSRLPDFFNQTIGLWGSGPIIRNKLFYFLLLEKQNELQPQPYAVSQYQGTSNLTQIMALADTLRRKYSYEPGSFSQIDNELKATRFAMKLDWNPDLKNKLTLSYRYNEAERAAPQQQNSGSVIRFSNNRYRLATNINSASLEWKRYFKKSANNRLLIAFNDEVTDRKVIGQPFPSVSITDGRGIITFGSNGTAHLNMFTAREFNLSDIFRFLKGNHAISTGLDFSFSKLNDVALGSYFGQYQYRSMDEFFRDAYPSRYVRTISLVDVPANDKTDAAAKFNTLRLGAFLNDEIQVNDRLKLTAGVRIDGNSLPLNPVEDVFFNSVARPEMAKYYDLEGGMSGRTMETHWQVSPRFGFNYKIPAKKMTLYGGAGIFTGHILNLWATELYLFNAYNLNIVPQQYGLRFNPDPFHQPDLQSLGIDLEHSKGIAAIVAEDLKYPTIFRTTVGMDRKFSHGWNFTGEIIFTRNIHEMNYTNINLLPSSLSTPLPDQRNIYSLNTNPERIPLPDSISNPYGNIMLLGNNHGKQGYSYSLTAAISKTIGTNLQASVFYSYGRSIAIFDPNGNANSSEGQWSQFETVNGKNKATRTISDFDPGHRVVGSVTKTLSYGKWATMVTLFYNGQSGAPFSYVYNGSMINDNGRQASFDLAYIPSQADLKNMNFIENTVNGISYTSEQQKEMLNSFIEGDSYLRGNRGEFAERNGARLPFTHIVDLRLRQDLRIKTRQRELQVSLIYDVFNFTNLINKNWGRSYFLSNNNFQLIRFVGFENTTTLTPMYQFTPINGTPWSVQNSSAPGSSARWISQLGIRISLN